MKSSRISTAENYSSTLLRTRVAFLIAVVSLIGISLFASSSLSSSNAARGGSAATSNEAVNRGFRTLLSEMHASSFSAPAPMLPAIEIFAGDCSTPKTVFNLQDADKTVCAKVTGAFPSWRIIWSNAKFVAVQNVPVGSGTSTFTLTSTSSLGDWRVILFEPFGGTVQQVTTFTVIDAAHPAADLSISKGAVSGNASAGSQVLFSLQVTNFGPSTADTVSFTDSVPANTTFVSFAQLSGPLFTCTNPTVGGTGDTVCTIASLNRSDTATFVATYTVGPASSGTVISNTASISSSTADPIPDNNSATAELEVNSGPCQLSTPDNITRDADTGQAGAVVTYDTPTGTGDCGQSTTGEGGETIPPISCNPASGSFFPAGTTTVICSAQTGSAVSFQVTINNPGGLSISLNGANSVTVECGTDFNDPGASAVNGTGQSVPVTVAYTPSFNPDAPAVGTYTATYTATEDPNSVSTTRTINVSDSEAPSITVNGANPYKIQLGSCSPFVDPGASALDSCAGAKPVTSSVSGPGGATSVNPGVAGTYVVTYTATDGSHSATATRTVLVGTFPEDEVDQPGTSNVPPTVTLNGDDQVTLECGTPFNDPGATATVCGNSIAVTTTGTVDIHTPGTYIVHYSATANGFTSEVTRAVTITADNTAPTITLNGFNPMTVECHTSFTDPGAVAHDACAGDFAATASGSVNPNVVGTYVLTYNATDPSGHAATPVTRTVNVVDTTGPTITLNGQSPTLWPPNHKYQTFQVTSFVTAVSDGCESSVGIGDVVIEKVTSDETENGNGDGNTTNDIVIAADCKSVQLRAERDGGGDGRVYTITFRVRDSAGNTTRATAQVRVPHNNGGTVIDSGVHYTVTGNCP